MFYLYFYLLPKDYIGSLSQEATEVVIKSVNYAMPKVYGILQIATQAIALVMSTLIHCTATGMASCVQWLTIADDSAQAIVCAYLGTALVVIGIWQGIQYQGYIAKSNRHKAKMANYKTKLKSIYEHARQRVAKTHDICASPKTIFVRARTSIMRFTSGKQGSTFTVGSRYKE